LGGPTWFAGLLFALMAGWEDDASCAAFAGWLCAVHCVLVASLPAAMCDESNLGGGGNLQHWHSL
jgi:hypothetical protein